QDRIDRAEDRRRRADAHCEGYRADDGEARVAAQATEGIAKIGEHCIDALLPAGVADLLANHRPVSDFPLRGAPRLGGREPAGDVLGYALLDIMADFVVDIGVRLGARKEHAGRAPELAPE